MNFSFSLALYFFIPRTTKTFHQMVTNIQGDVCKKIVIIIIDNYTSESELLDSILASEQPCQGAAMPLSMRRTKERAMLKQERGAVSTCLNWITMIMTMTMTA